MTGLGVIAGQFLLCAALILWSGIRLSRYGDVIAEKTGLGGTWIGLVLMATVTSLPELITGASSMLVFDVPDIAAGDAIGSCLFNLVILGILDARHAEPISARIHRGHILSAGFGIVQLGLVGLAILAGTRAPVFGWFGLHSVAFIAIYVLAVRTIFLFERARVAEIAEELTGDFQYREFTLRRAVTLYVAMASVLVGAATMLPGVAEQLAGITGLEQSFVGSLFVAAATSLPELVVSTAAAGIGAVDMAAANLFGSNLFNVAVLGIDDLLYGQPLLAAVSPSHMVTVVSAIMMTGVAVIGLTFRARRKRFRLSWDVLAIVAIYLTAITLSAIEG
ncbi:MAG: sodium:calcium antiporter [Acidimicrobiia bacterium]|nr:sodium:calcium antiporter [Acidimicrobiia bacterium]